MSSQPNPAPTRASASAPCEPLVFTCPWCHFTTNNRKGLNTHTGHRHREERRRQLLSEFIPPTPNPVLVQRQPPASAASSSNQPGTSLSDPQPSSGPPLPQDPAAHLASNKRTRRVLPRIPRSVRPAAARLFVNVLQAVHASNSPASWLRLLEFAYRVLHVSADLSHLTLAMAVRQNISGFDRVLCPVSRPLVALGRQSDEQLAHLAEKRLTSRGDLRGAVRILSSRESLISFDDPAALAEMQRKHPSAHVDEQPAEDAHPVAHRSCSSTETLAALNSFPAGSSAGLDGLTPQHIKDLLSVGGETARAITSSLAKICDILSRGAVPTEIAPAVLGAWLIAARKPSGDLRPIAVGSVFRRLAAKIVLARVKERASEYLRPRQLGFGTKGGTEIGVHAVRTYLQSNEKCVLLKLDFANAFNSHRRDTMLRETLEHAPELYRLALQAYKEPTPIFFGNHRIWSHAGCQQGDVTSPLLFSLVLHKALSRLDSALTLAYLDDVSLGDSDVNKVLTDVARLQEDHRVHGLNIKPAKCELFIQGFTSEETEAIRTRFAAALPGLRYLHERSSVGLLGAPVFTEGVALALQSKSSSFDVIHSRLQHVTAHAATYIMQRAAGVQKLLYVLRAAPCFTRPDALTPLDERFTCCMERILKTSLSDSAMSQASLPVSSGGLGVTLPSDLALPAFLSSASAVDVTVNDILHRDFDAPVAFATLACDMFAARHGPLPDPEDRASQSAWGKISAVTTLTALKASSAASDVDLLRLSHAAEPSSGMWLHAFPSSSIGTLLSDREFVIAVGLRLGLRLIAPHTCACGAAVSSTGIHKLSCSMATAGRESRHGAINGLISRAFRQAGIANTREPRHLSHRDELRPDGLTLEPWSRGKCLIWDATVRDTYAPSYRHIARNVGAVAEKGENEKRLKYASISSEYIFAPFAIESSGVWGKAALELTSELGRRIKHRSGENRATGFLRQGISIEVQRGNARMVLQGQHEPPFIT